MDKATKAALFSALLFPGWGQFYLKEYKRGIMFVVPVLAGMLSLCWAITQVAFNILKASPFQKGTSDVAAVIKLSMDSIKAIAEQGVATPCSIFLILLFMVILWIISTIDAYQLGKKLMAAPTTAVRQESTSNPV